MGKLVNGMYLDCHSSLDCDVTMQTLKYECALKNLYCHILTVPMLLGALTFGKWMGSISALW